MMEAKENPKLAIIETSHRSGWVALAQGDRVLSKRCLEEARRHARDLVPMLGELFAEQGWKARDLDGVIVGKGPGSYTGLRVGIMSAKTLAYATGCALLAVDTFAAIARQTPTPIQRVDVIADAQQDRIYVQECTHHAPRDDIHHGERDEYTGGKLRIESFPVWLDSLAEDVYVSGPGLEIFAPRLPGDRLIAQGHWLPQPESLLALGLEALRQGRRDDPFTVEPLYLRPSSAEELAVKRKEQKQK